MDKIQRIFNELKNKRLIKADYKLVENTNSLNFKSSVLKDKIIYNPYFNKISSGSIRFTLLHEIGHKQSVQYGYVGILVSTIASLIVYFIALWLSKLTLIFFALVIITFFLVFRCFIPLMKRNEFEADLWAAKQIQKGYPMIKPSTMLAAALKEVLTLKFKQTVWTLMLRNIYKLLRYHPTDKERISRIKEFEKHA